MAVYDPVIRRYAPTTQRILNQLPDHDKIRRERDSNGQLLINSIFGRYLYDIEIRLEKKIRDNFLETATMDVPDVVYRAGAEPSQEYRSPGTTKNHIRNGSFEIWTNQIGPPDWWVTSTADSTTWSVSETGGVKGNRHMSLNIPTTSSDASLVTYINHSSTPRYYKTGHPLLNDRQFPFKKGDKVTISFYYKLSSDSISSGALRLWLEPSGRETSLSSTYVDVSATYSTSWTRFSYLYTVPEDLISLGVGVDSTITSSAELDVAVDQFQLEFNEQVTDWQPFFRDKPYHMDYLNLRAPAPVVSETGTRAQYTDKDEIFWRGLPTRVTYKSVSTVSNPGSGIAGYVKEVDYWGDTWLCRWTTDGSYIYKKGVDSEAVDQYGKYQLAYYTAYGNYIVGTEAGYNGDYTTTIRALTYFQETLWAVVEVKKHMATGSAAASASTFLCAIDPSTWWAPGEPDYLESKAVMELTSISGTPERIDFKWEDGSYIYVTTNDSGTYKEHVYQLHRDYFTFDTETKQGYFRESYDSVTLEPVRRTTKQLDEIVRKP